MPSKDAERLAQAMQNSLAAQGGSRGDIWRLTYRSDEGAIVFNAAQIANVLDARPGLEVMGGVNLRQDRSFVAHLAATRDIPSLAESIPVWVVVEADTRSGRWRLDGIGGPMTKEQAGVPSWEVVLPSSVEEALDPVEHTGRSAKNVVRETVEAPLEVIAESAIPGWVWAVAAVGGAVALGPNVLDAIRTFRS